MSNNLGRHHRRSIRLQGYDYSQAGMYFVTTCTYERKSICGEIAGGTMVTNKYGRIVEMCWEKLPSGYQGVELDACVVMPNHVHGIIVVADSVGTHAGAMHIGAVHVGAIHELPLPRSTRRSMLIPKVIGRFKMNTAKRINALRGTPGFPLWQRNYYEHVIRNEDDLHRIREYIQTNPLRWELDKENPVRRGEDEFDQWMDSLSRKRGRDGK